MHIKFTKQHNHTVNRIVLKTQKQIHNQRHSLKSFTMLFLLEQGIRRGGGEFILLGGYIKKVSFCEIQNAQISNTIILTLQNGFEMKKRDFQLKMSEDCNFLTRPKIHRRIFLNQTSTMKALSKLNTAKLPDDFFPSAKKTQDSEIKLKEIPVEKENQLDTPRFSSHNGAVPKLRLNNLQQQSTADGVSIRSFISQRLTQRDKQLHSDRPYQVNTAKSPLSSDDDICNHLRDIIRLTTSMKKVYRKHSLDIKRIIPKPRNLVALQLPPLTTDRTTFGFTSSRNGRDQPY